jgi:CP family cyanate transporter-like MFS transporter
MDTNPAGTAQAERLFVALPLLWLAGIALRLTILCVPPAIPAIHDDLSLNATQVGILTGLPSLLFALAAVPGSLLIARLGVKTALIIGLAVTAVFGALRGLVADVAWLYAMTIAMSVGVAVMQGTMPPAVRAWAPSRIGLATATYTNGLLIGEILPGALMLTLVMPLTGTWQRGFVVWSVPVAMIAVAAIAIAPRQSPATANRPGAAARHRWWPNWRDPLMWRIGLMLGTVSAAYFGINGFIPDYLRSTGQAEWISAALSGLNLGQLPASALLLAFAGRYERNILIYVVIAGVALLSTIGIVFASGPWVVAFATLEGFCGAAGLILLLALPPRLSEPDDVHRVTAAMFTISYTCAVVIPVISGALWDLSGIGALAFLPIALCNVALAALAPAVSQIGRAHS